MTFDIEKFMSEGAADFLEKEKFLQLFQFYILPLIAGLKCR